MADPIHTDLWDVLRRKATPEQLVLVRRLAKDASDVLDTVVETFPTYTLHNHVHAENVLSLMSALLGSRLNDLSALETAMLILVAYHHDIGMVFTEEERLRLHYDQFFDEFLTKHPDAYIAVTKADGEVPIEVAEWYCRWRHADRVIDYLARIPEEHLLWGVVSLFPKLADLCRSHNKSPSFLKDDRIFETNYLADCDLRFCAVLLRLADILDFDNSRSPNAVYALMGLSRRESKRESISDVEWRKHISSAGFKFPSDRRLPYELEFIAGPDEPSVEYDLRAFLAIIEDELRECASVLRSCSERWRDFVLPERISRSNIRSRGYKYGEYRLDLDRTQVLALFMGENLYDSKYAFVRELLQNAMDTSRHRVFFERSRGAHTYKPTPIQVTEWFDEENYHWIRIDDFGMGMDEDIIRNFFLRVGSSFYNSSSFRAELLRYETKTKERFLPISRFGIGLLSCFIICDRLEVATRRINLSEERAPGIRLSMPGLETFYTLQTDMPEYMIAKPMPALRGHETGYRTEPGTSIAVRLDAKRQVSDLDLGALLRQLVLCSSVPIVFEDEVVGGDAAILVDSPWTVAHSIDLGSEAKARIEYVFDCELETAPRVEVVPLDLTSASASVSRDFRGQMLAVYIEGGKELDDALRNERYSSIRKSISSRLKEGSLEFSFQLEIDVSALERDVSELERRVEERLSEYFNSPTESNVCSEEELRNLRQSESGRAGYGVAVKARVQRLLAQSREISRHIDQDESVQFPELAAVEELARVLGKSFLEGDSPRVNWPGGRRMQTVNIGLDVLFNRDEESTLTLVDYIQRSPTWSHNGIAIPTKFLVADYYEDVEGRGTLELPNFGEHNAGGLVFGCFALTDQLRPEISITRDVLRSLPWNIHATSSLAFMRARTNAATDRLRGWWSAGLFNVPINQDERFLGSIRDDPLLWNERGWPSERIIWTNLGVMSLKEIREACVEGGNEVELFVPTVDLLLKGSVSSWFEEFDFLLPCRAVLVQLGLSVVWRLDDEITGGSLVVKGPDAEPVPEGLWHFPPLFFIPYENSSLLQQHRKALNRRHLFSQWLIEEAPLLARKYPGVLAALRSELGWGGPNEDTMTEQQRYLRINESLERLRRLEPGLGIGRRIFLRKEDFSS